MPDAPSGFDPMMLNHWLWWKLKCFEAQGTEFQQLFERVMQRVLGEAERFVPVRPYGNMGDKKNDGMLLHSGVIFAAYSPDEFKQAALVTKIKEDLEGAIDHWKDKGLKRWAATPQTVCVSTKATRRWSSITWRTDHDRPSFWRTTLEANREQARRASTLASTAAKTDVFAARRKGVFAAPQPGILGLLRTGVFAAPSARAWLPRQMKVCPHRGQRLSPTAIG